MPYRIVSSGEMAELIRRFHWEKTSLGRIESWPDELISTVNLLLESRYPMFLWWGPERIQFYNDAYRPSLGENMHPAALGQRGEESWRELWSTIGPEVDGVMSSGKPTWNVDRMMPIFREGRLEEAFWTYAYSPVRDREGRVEGVVVVCNETTEQVLNERRLLALLTLDRKPGELSPDELAAQMLAMLGGDRADIPFAVIYRVSEENVQPVGHLGLTWHQVESLGSLPVAETAITGSEILIEKLEEHTGALVCKPWPEPIRMAFLQPAGNTLHGRYVLVLGVSPRLGFQGSYSSFLRLAGNRICQILERAATQQERRLAEQQRANLFETVDQQRELLASIVESTPAGIALLDDELRIRWCNPFFCGFFEAAYNSQEAVGHKLTDLAPNLEEVLKILRRVRDTHQPFTAAEYEHTGFARGTTYWRWSLVRLQTGELLTVSSEVTEQVLARRRTEKIGERLRLAQKTAHLGTYYWQLPSGKLEWSPEFYEATGLSTQLAASWENYLAHVDPLDRVRLRQELAGAAAEDGSFQIRDHRLLDGRGGERWIAITGEVHYNSIGTPESVLGTVSDITERKRSEKALEESRKEAQRRWAELEAIYGTAPIGLSLFDPVEFRYLRVNNRLAEIVGLPPEQILGRTATEVAPLKGLREMLEQAARGKPVTNELLEGELPASPGEHRYWRVNYFPVYDSDGSIQAISSAVLEITALRRAELALVQSEKIAAVGRLASSISHEINNPLEAVTNLLYLLRSEKLSAEGTQYLRWAERELARVSQIATHTLRFHRQSTRPTEASAEEMIDPILALYHGRINTPAIQIERQYKSEEKVLCFEGDVRQVLNNLIGNSIDAMWRGGRLRLRSRVVTDWPSGRRGLRITIADTGHGMSETTQQRLFDAFYTTKGIKGTGLGLWISSEIVRKHGGRLSFRSSTREGHSGTVFQLFLPSEPAFLEQQDAVRTLAS